MMAKQLVHPVASLCRRIIIQWVFSLLLFVLISIEFNTGVSDTGLSDIGVYRFENDGAYLL